MALLVHRVLVSARGVPCAARSGSMREIMDRWIDSLQRRAAAQDGGLPLSGGLPLADLFPQEQLLACHAALTSTSDSSALQYAWPEGSEFLREWVAARLRARGARTIAENVIITTGAQQALVVLCSVLKLGGQRVGVDPVTYSGALDVFRRAHALPVVASRASAIYVVPGSSNPEGRGLSEARRQELLAAGCPILADEAYAELRYDETLERPLIADAEDRVFHVGTLSKTLCPGLRLGWLVAPPAYRQSLLDAKRDLDLQAPSLSQALVERLLADFDWDAHLSVQRKEYRTRMDLLMAAARKHLPEFTFYEPEGGFTLFLTYRGEELWDRAETKQVDAADHANGSSATPEELALLEAATRHGTSFDPGSMFQSAPEAAPLMMRVSPCGVAKQDIEQAVARLARAFHEVRASSQRTGRSEVLDGATQLSKASTGTPSAARGAAVERRGADVHTDAGHQRAGDERAGG